MVTIILKNYTKFFLILIFSLLFSYPSFAKTGEGKLKLNSSALDFFIIYLKGGNNQWPESFIISEDSSWYTYYYCAYGPGKCGGSDIPAISECRKITGKKFGTFAKGKVVKWKNGINPGKGKISRFNSKWDRSQIIAKLTELGFYGNTPISEKTGKKEKELNKTENELKKTENLVSQLNSLKDLYDTGALTKEEFDKAKKKIIDQ